MPSSWQNIVLAEEKRIPAASVKLDWSDWQVIASFVHHWVRIDLQQRLQDELLGETQDRGPGLWNTGCLSGFLAFRLHSASCHQELDSSLWLKDKRHFSWTAHEKSSIDVGLSLPKTVEMLIQDFPFRKVCSGKALEYTYWTGCFYALSMCKLSPQTKILSNYPCMKRAFTGATAVQPNGK